MSEHKKPDYSMHAKENAGVQAWEYPDFSSSDDGEKGPTAIGKRAEWYREKVVEEMCEEEEEIAPLTAEEIEAIRLAAYEDGLKEGHSEGYAKGEEEGRLEGLKKGHEAGFEQGHQEGLASGSEAIQEATSRWQALVDRLHQPLSEMDQQVEQQLIWLATALAKELIMTEAKINPEVVLVGLKQAIDVLPELQAEVTIALHPDDLEWVHERYDESMCQERNWRLLAEPTLQRGECIVSNYLSSVDMRFSARIEELLRNFFQNNRDLS